MNLSEQTNGILRAATHPCQQCRFAAADASLGDHILVALEYAIKQEREACARVVEGFRTGGSNPETVNFWGEALAAAIRARNQT